VARAGTARGDTLRVGATAVAGVVGDETDLGEGGEAGRVLVCRLGTPAEPTTGTDELLADTVGGR